MKFNLLYILLVVVILSACSSKKSVTSTSLKSASYEHIKNTLQLNDKEMHTPLYEFIAEWYGVPYKYGECSKNGIDCSGFVNLLYQKVYHKTLERNSNDIFQKQCKKINKNDLKEGDLVFFKVDSKEISHVGVYLRNNKFVHASTKKGVMISDLNEPYFQKHFYAFGRLK